MPSISFQPTVEDVLAARRLHFTTSLKAKRIQRSYLRRGAICATAGLAVAWFLDLPLVLTAVVGLAYWFLFLSLCLLAAYLRLPGQTRRTFAQQKSLQDNFTIEWSDVGISTTSERGHSQFKWQDFITIVEGRDAIVLRQSDMLFNFIPKRALSDEQAASIMQHAARAG